MEIKKGDLVITLPKVENIKKLNETLTRGMIGVVTNCTPKFNDIKVYEVVIDNKFFYLFEDEIKKMEV